MGPVGGQVACLLAAACWALAVAFFRDPIARHGAWTVNLGKNLLGTFLLGLTVLAVGQFDELMNAPAVALGWLAFSGILGLTVGDTALFAAVPRLGPHRSLLFLTLGPVFAALLAWLLFDERQTPVQLAGSVMVLLGVVIVVWRPASERRRAGVDTPDDWPLAGIGFALLAAFGLGAGIVFAKGGMEEVPLVAASFVRMAASVAGLLVIMALLRRLGPTFDLLGDRGAMLRLAGPTILGTYVAFLLMMAGIAWAPASVAAVLLATPPVFSLFIDARLFGTPITWRGLVGTALSVVGVAVLSLAA